MKRLVIVLFVLCMIAPLWGQTEMPAYILVKAIDGWNPDDPGVYMAGYPVDVSDHNRIGGKQVPPKFIQVVITDATVDEAKAYCESWNTEIDWSVENQNVADDWFQIMAFVKPELVSASGLNRLTRTQIEGFLNKWNAAVISVGTNAVVFEVYISDAIVSEGFWGYDVSSGIFTEKKYDIPTGVHTVELDYSALPMNELEARMAIEMNGCTFTKSLPNYRLEFECSRATIRSAFKKQVKSKVDKMFSRRKWSFTQSVIDAAYANEGTVEATRMQALQYLHNRLDD